MAAREVQKLRFPSATVLSALMLLALGGGEVRAQTAQPTPSASPIQNP